MNIYQSPTTQSKFQVYCSCIHCKLEVSIQNIERHYNSKHTFKSNCLQCSLPLISKNKFCSTSCAATYNNSKRDYSTFRPGPKPGVRKSSRTKLCSVCHTRHSGYKKTCSLNCDYVYNNSYTKISYCVICNKIHPRSGKTCSDNCYKTLISLKMKQAISNGYDPKKNRGRGKKSYLEISFESWLNQHFPDMGYIPEYPIKRLDIVKTYFGDFYFPELNLIIELDGTQHDNTKDYDRDRDAYITETYGIRVFRITHKEYASKIKLDIVVQLLTN